MAEKKRPESNAVTPEQMAHFIAALGAQEKSLQVRIAELEGVIKYARGALDAGNETEASLILKNANVR